MVSAGAAKASLADDGYWDKPGCSLNRARRVGVDTANAAGRTITGAPPGGNAAQPRKHRHLTSLALAAQCQVRNR